VIKLRDNGRWQARAVGGRVMPDDSDDHCYRFQRTIVMPMLARTTAGAAYHSLRSHLMPQRRCTAYLLCTRHQQRLARPFWQNCVYFVGAATRRARTPYLDAIMDTILKQPSGETGICCWRKASLMRTYLVRALEAMHTIQNANLALLIWREPPLSRI